jgi:Uma2 family endonuclease
VIFCCFGCFLCTKQRRWVTLKKIAYLNLTSLQEYWLVEQDRCEIEVFRRSENWALTYYVLGDTITSDVVGISLTVADIYDNVENQHIAALLVAQR